MASNIPANGLLEMAGIDPKTRKPKKASNRKVTLYDFLTTVRIRDEQEYVNSIVVHTPGLNISSQEFMRTLYYWNDLALMFIGNKPYLLPYTLSNGGLDFYGRYNNISPVPLNGETASKDTRKLLSEITKQVIYEVKAEDELNENDWRTSAVLVRGYTQQRAEKALPAQKVNDPVCQFESTIFSYLRTALLLGTGVKGIKAGDDMGAEAIEELSRTLEQCAINGTPYVGITSTVDFQELSSGGTYAVNDYLLAIQAIDNYRKQANGVDTNGVFDKQAYVNETQTKMNQITSHSLVDRFNQLQNSFDIWNSITGLDWYAEIPQNVVAPLPDQGEEGNTENQQEGTDNVDDQGNE